MTVFPACDLLPNCFSRRVAAISERVPHMGMDVGSLRSHRHSGEPENICFLFDGKKKESLSWFNAMPLGFIKRNKTVNTKITVAFGAKLCE